MRLGLVVADGVASDRGDHQDEQRETVTEQELLHGLERDKRDAGGVGGPLSDGVSADRELGGQGEVIA